MEILVNSVTVTKSLLRFQYKILVDGIVVDEKFATCDRDKTKDPLEQAVIHATAIESN